MPGRSVQAGARRFSLGAALKVARGVYDWA